MIGEIAWSGPEERPLEKKAWKAYCIAAKKTGSLVSTHASRGVQLYPQIKYLLENGSSVVVRPSGTEPKLKTYISVIAENAEEAENVERRIVENLQGVIYN